MKILLIGRTGQLGNSLLAVAQGHTIIAPPRNELDIGSPLTVENAIRQHKPDVLINTAAFHNVPLCEDQAMQALAINCVAVRDIAEICRDTDCLLVTFSSDYVFAGDQRTPYAEDSPAGPLQMYGVTRLAGELAARNTAPNHTLVIRTCGLYGINGARSKGGNFVDNRITDARSQPHLEISCEQTVSPTFSDDLAHSVMQLVEHPNRTPGIYHLTNEGECSWYEFTKAIYDIVGLDVVLKPIDRRGLSGKMRRPLYSALANNKARSLGIRLPHWRDALERYLNAKYSISSELPQ